MNSWDVLIVSPSIKLRDSDNTPAPIMPLSEDLERLLPKLRRFARAATADKALADACVERALKDLISGSTHLQNDQPPPDQIQLYRAVERVLEAEAKGSFEKQAWRALILVFVEGFSEIETARVLGVDASRIKSMVASAEAQVRSALSKDYS